MIKSFRHKGLEKFHKTGNKAGIQAHHEKRLRAQLSKLDTASGPGDMDLPGWKLHPLSDDLEGHYAVWVNGNWRVIFTFDEDGDAVLVDYRDYH